MTDIDHFAHQRRLNRLAFYEERLKEIHRRRLEDLKEEERIKQAIAIITTEDMQEQSA